MRTTLSFTVEGSDEGTLREAAASEIARFTGRPYDLAGVADRDHRNANRGGPDGRRRALRRPLGGRHHGYASAAAPMTRLSAFLRGMAEFRSLVTSNPGADRIDAYDRGRDLAHRLALRRLEDR